MILGFMAYDNNVKALILVKAVTDLKHTWQRKTVDVIFRVGISLEVSTSFSAPISIVELKCYVVHNFCFLIDDPIKSLNNEIDINLSYIILI